MMSSNESVGGHSAQTTKELIINEDVLCRIELLKSLQESFVCRRCGECCRRHEAIALTENDILRVSRKKNLSPENFIEQYHLRFKENPGNLNYYHLPIGENSACPFYYEHKCTIYEDRPQVCRGFPFLTPENVQNAFEMNSVIVLGGKCEAAIDHVERVVSNVSTKIDGENSNHL